MFWNVHVTSLKLSIKTAVLKKISTILQLATGYLNLNPVYDNTCYYYNTKIELLIIICILLTPINNRNKTINRKHKIVKQINTLIHSGIYFNLNSLNMQFNSNLYLTVESRFCTNSKGGQLSKFSCVHINTMYS